MAPCENSSARSKHCIGNKLKKSICLRPIILKLRNVGLTSYFNAGLGQIDNTDFLRIGVLRTGKSKFFEVICDRD